MTARNSLFHGVHGISRKAIAQGVKLARKGEINQRSAMDVFTFVSRSAPRRWLAHAKLRPGIADRRHRSRCVRIAAANVLPSFNHVSSGR